MSDVFVIGLPFSTCIPNCQVVVENYGSVQMISIDRQDKRNAVDPATAKELFSAFKQFDADKDMTVAVLYGKGEIKYNIINYISNLCSF